MNCHVVLECSFKMIVVLALKVQCFRASKDLHFISKLQNLFQYVFLYYKPDCIFFHFLLVRSLVQQVAGWSTWPLPRAQRSGYPQPELLQILPLRLHNVESFLHSSKCTGKSIKSTFKTNCMPVWNALVNVFSIVASALYPMFYRIQSTV